jgi:hypothetical protein
MSYSIWEMTRLLVLVAAIVIWSFAVWRRKLALACGALGAVVGMYAFFVLFEFVAVFAVSTDYAYISFAVIGQTEHHPLLEYGNRAAGAMAEPLEYPNRRAAAAMAEPLNALLSGMGAVVGAAAGFGAGRLCLRLRGSLAA